jgi:hypothetical protein
MGEAPGQELGHTVGGGTELGQELGTHGKALGEELGITPKDGQPLGQELGHAVGGGTELGEELGSDLGDGVEVGA